MQVPGHQALRELGFSDLEARVYVALLSKGALSAYAVARAVRRAPPNIYGVLESLTRRGAVLTDGRERRLYRAVAVRDLLKAIKQGFDRDSAAAEAALRNVVSHDAEPGVFQLETVEQVFVKASGMLAGAESVVLLDGFPQALAMLARDLLKLRKRRKHVVVKAYDDRPIVATRWFAPVMAEASWIAGRESG